MTRPIPISLYWLLAFLVMLFYGIVMLLPPRTKTRKKRKLKTSTKIEAITSIVLGAGGVTLIVFAFAAQNKTAKAIFSYFVVATLAIGFVLVVVELIMKLRKKMNAPKHPKNFIIVGNIKVLYGISTPDIFEGSKYRVAYETMVQEAEIPFITCELHTVLNDQHIGDIIFESKSERIAEKKLRHLPILEIHIY